MPNKQIVLTLVLFTSIHNTTAELINDQAATNINSLCDEEYYLKKLAEHLQRKLEKQTQGLKEAAVTATKYEIATAATRKPEQRCLVSALAQLARHVANKKAATAEAQDTQLTDAIKAIHKQRGVLQAAIEFSKLKVAIDPSNVHGTTPPTTTMLKFKVDHSGSPACVLPDESSPRNIGWTQPKPENLIQLKLTAVEALKSLHKLDKVTLGATSGSCDTAPDTRSIQKALTGCDWSGGATATVDEKNVKHTAITPSTTQVYKDSQSKKECAANSAAKTGSASSADKLADLICAAMEVSHCSAEMPELTGEVLQNNEIIQTAVAACTPGFSQMTKLNDIRSSEELKNYIKAKYGAGKDGFDRNFKALIATRNVPTREGDEIKPKAIE
uniref:Variant surface glycoprotein 1125.1369 n=1 Tax=Trypanosoma brucei TaxID=5691 RepID=A0A1J0R737_9TRYP|nr:variant surface glycoprotein 1125.1369 [Trypanosoma brucei]